MYKREIPIITVSDQLRFWSKVKKTDTCWLWAGAKSSGYGNMRINNEVFRAHRISYKLHYKEPNQLEVCHDCHVRLCVNPEHLYLGTHSENMQHTFDDGRHSLKGELHSNTILQTEVDEIIELLDKGLLTQRQIANCYHISTKTVQIIKRGTHWGVVNR